MKCFAIQGQMKRSLINHRLITCEEGEVMFIMHLSVTFDFCVDKIITQSINNLDQQYLQL